jgi:hypothetical protein
MPQIYMNTDGSDGPTFTTATVLDYDFGYDSATTCVTFERYKQRALPNIWTIVSSGACRDALAVFTCSLMYQYKCTNGVASVTSKSPCKHICDQVVSSCSADELAAINPIIKSKFQGFEISSGTCGNFPNDSTGATCNLGRATYSPPPPTIAPTCESYAGTACKGVSSGSIYIPAGMTQAMLEAKVKATMFLFNIAPIATGCDKQMASMVCGQAFMPCYPISVPVGATTFYTYLPTPVSRSVCDAYQVCSLLYAHVHLKMHIRVRIHIFAFAYMCTQCACIPVQSACATLLINPAMAAINFSCTGSGNLQVHHLFV